MSRNTGRKPSFGRSCWRNRCSTASPTSFGASGCFHDDTGAEFFLTLTDPDTLYLQEHYETDGAPAVRTAVYERVDAFLPETLQTCFV